MDKDMKYKPKNSYTTVSKTFNLKLPYMGKTCNGKVKKLIEKYKLLIRLNNKLGLPLNKRWIDCDIYKILHCKYSCRDT